MVVRINLIISPVIEACQKRIVKMTAIEAKEIIEKEENDANSSRTASSF